MSRVGKQKVYEDPEAWLRARRAIKRYFLKSPFRHMRIAGKFLNERFLKHHQYQWRECEDGELLINKVYRRAQDLHNPTGKRGKIKLMDYQCIMLCCVFLFKRGHIPPRIAMLIARKQGKTTFCALLAVLMVEFSQDTAPEVFCCGETIDQAQIVYQSIMRILALEGNKVGSQGGAVPPEQNWVLNQNELKYRPNLGVIRRFASDPKTALGKNYTLLIMDEAALLSKDLFAALEMGQSAARGEQFIVGLSTAGTDRDAHFKKIIETTNREVENEKSPTWITIPFYIDEDEQVDISDEKVWRALNPALEDPDVFNIQIIRDEYHNLVGKGMEHDFAVFRLNRWGRGEMDYIGTKDQIKATRAEREDVEKQLLTNPCKIGLDLGLTRSMTAISVVCHTDDLFYAKIRYFTPETWFKRRLAEGQGHNDFFIDNRNQGIIKIDGHKKQTHQKLQEELEMIVEKYRPNELVRDQYTNGLQFLADFEESGYFDCTVLTTSSAKKAAVTNPLIDAVRSGKLRVEYNEVFEWEMKGALMIEDEQRGFYDIDRASSLQTVDGLYALMFGMYGFIADGTGVTQFGMENALLGA